MVRTMPPQRKRPTGGVQRESGTATRGVLCISSVTTSEPVRESIRAPRGTSNCSPPARLRVGSLPPCMWPCLRPADRRGRRHPTRWVAEPPCRVHPAFPVWRRVHTRAATAAGFPREPARRSRAHRSGLHAMVRHIPRVAPAAPSSAPERQRRLRIFGLRRAVAPLSSCSLG